MAMSAFGVEDPRVSKAYTRRDRMRRRANRQTATSAAVIGGGLGVASAGGATARKYDIEEHKQIGNAQVARQNAADQLAAGDWRTSAAHTGAATAHLDAAKAARTLRRVHTGVAGAGLGITAAGLGALGEGLEMRRETRPR